MNLNNLNVGKMLIAKVLSQSPKHTKQWTVDQQEQSQTPSKNINKENK